MDESTRESTPSDAKPLPWGSSEDFQRARTTLGEHVRRASTSTWAERENALDVLDDVTHWTHMSAVGWMEIDELVAAMSSALDNEDWKAAKEAVIELELKSPCRCRRPPPDAESTPAATRTAVLTLMEKIRSNTCPPDTASRIGNR